ncbi:MAG: hypothetical protein C0617_14055 [Desulfuromonas sp.]|nr:MAG: hypothetical protein C0617_14055 [Desulfuromonas sp.]
MNIPTAYSCFTDLWLAAARDVLESGMPTSPRNLETREIVFWAERLTNPRERLLEIPGRLLNPFFLIGELLWILRGSDNVGEIEYYLSLIRKYSDDGVSLHGAYGPRLFGRHKHQKINQAHALVEKLRKDPDSRQAVLQIYLPQADWAPTLDVPCLCQIQFLIRDHKLHAIATMRSQDVFRGMPYDVAWMSLLQEHISMQLNIDLGSFTHVCGSLHLYQADMPLVEQLMAAAPGPGMATHGREMTPLPCDVTGSQIDAIMKTEESLRTNKPLEVEEHVTLKGLWAEVAILLQAYTLFKNGDSPKAITLTRSIGGALGEMAEKFILKK